MFWHNPGLNIIYFVTVKLLILIFRIFAFMTKNGLKMTRAEFHTGHHHFVKPLKLLHLNLSSTISSGAETDNTLLVETKVLA